MSSLKTGTDTIVITENFIAQRDFVFDSIFIPVLRSYYSFEFNVFRICKTESTLSHSISKHNLSDEELDNILTNIVLYFDDTKDDQSFITMRAFKDNDEILPFMSMIFHGQPPHFMPDLSPYDPSFFREVNRILSDQILLGTINPMIMSDFFNYQQELSRLLCDFLYSYFNDYECNPNKNQIKTLFLECEEILNIPLNDIHDDNLKLFFQYIIDSFKLFLEERELAIICKNCGSITNYHPTKIACSDKCRKSLQNKRNYQKSLAKEFE
jgi:hypothetical protein